MQKNKEQNVPVESSAEEATERLEREKAMKDLQEVAARIEAVLQETGYALQNYMIRSEYGDRPAVRLVKLPNTPKDEPTANTEVGDEGTKE